MTNITDYQICSKTVMDTSDPSITFDEEGISNHYWQFHNIVKPNWHPDSGHFELSRHIERIKASGKSRDFDCIIGLSGGLDSSYLLHKMVTEYSLKPLVFHVDGGWNSEIAVHNINVLVDKLNLDLFTEVINWNEMRDFQLAMFKSGVPHLDIPQDLAFVSVLYRFAAKYGIKYILNGGNISTECVLMPLQILYWGTDMVHIKDILSKFGQIKMQSYPFSSALYHKVYLPYIRRMKVLKPLNYMRFVKQEAVDELVKVYNWKPYAQKHFESNFTRFFESYWLPTRFNYDMRRNQLSSLILTDQISRTDALSILSSSSYDLDSINYDLQYISNKLDVSLDSLQHFHSMELKYFWDYRNQNNFFQLGERILSKISKTRRGGAF